MRVPEAKIPSVDIFARSASYVDRILKGTKPAFVDSLRALGDVPEWFNERLNCRGMSALNTRARRSPQAAPCPVGGRFTGQERAGLEMAPMPSTRTAVLAMLVALLLLAPAVMAETALPDHAFVSLGPWK